VGEIWGEATGSSRDSDVEKIRRRNDGEKRGGVVTWSKICGGLERDTPTERGGREVVIEGEEGKSLRERVGKKDQVKKLPKGEKMMLKHDCRYSTDST
jgi:hypothetical protein